MSALGEGTAELTVKAGGVTRVLRVSVVDEPSVVEISGPTTMTVGTTAWIRVNFDALPNFNEIKVRSSDSKVVSAEYEMTSSGLDVQLTAHRAGKATIEIQAGEVSRTWYVTVVGEPTIAYVSHSTRILPGTSTTLLISMTASLTKQAEIKLASSNPEVVEVPSKVVVPAGVDYATLSLRVGEPGTTVISATLGERTVATTVIVLEKVALSSLSVTPANVVMGHSAILLVSLSGPAPSDLPVKITYENEGILGGATNGVILAGQSTAYFVLESQSVGETNIRVETNGEERLQSVRVVERPILSHALIPASINVGVPAGVYLSLDVWNPEPITISVTVADPDIINAPETITIEAGTYSTYLYVKGLREGTTTLTVKYEDDEHTGTINVVSP